MSFVLRTTCECFSRSKCHTFQKKASSETKLFRMARSHSTSTTSWELAFPRSHMVSLPIPDTTQVPQTIDHVLTVCSFALLGLRGSVIFSTSSYPKWVATNNPFPRKYVFLKKTFICRTHKFRKRRNSESLIASLQNMQLFLKLLAFLFGVIVETLWLQSGKTLIPVRVISQSFI